MTENRTKTGRFKKGYSGNPGGRPKLPEGFSEAVKVLAEGFPEWAAKRLNDPKMDDAMKLRIYQTVLDRAYGKPIQSADITATTIPQGDFILEIGGDE